MPLIEKRTVGVDLELGLWKIEEDETFFRQKLRLSEEHETHLSKMHKKRRLEWLAGRWLIKLIAGKKSICLKDRFGKPYLKNSKKYISISHSNGLVAVSLGKRSLGIDIQQIVPKIRRIAHKFMRHIEASSLKTEFYLDHLTTYWSAKEALYKAYGKKELDFRRHILVNPFQYQQAGNFTGTVLKDKFHADYELNYEKIGNHILVYAMEKIRVPFSKNAVIRSI